MRGKQTNQRQGPPDRRKKEDVEDEEEGCPCQCRMIGYRWRAMPAWSARLALGLVWFDSDFNID